MEYQITFFSLRTARIPPAAARMNHGFLTTEEIDCENPAPGPCGLDVRDRPRAREERIPPVHENAIRVSGVLIDRRLIDGRSDGTDLRIHLA